jgi:hypothetical protein
MKTAGKRREEGGPAAARPDSDGEREGGEVLGCGGGEEFGRVGLLSMDDS